MTKRYWLYTLLLCVTLLVAALAYERSSVTSPTPKEVAQAEQYGEQTNKPTPPRAFVFDGCTLFPDRVFGNSFDTACLEHDIAYWYGGTAAERAAADHTFKQAVAQQGMTGTILQHPMFWMVRLFGDSLLLQPLDANWGFGYN